MSNILDEIKRLPAPTVIEVNEFDTLLNENIALAKEVLGSDWQPLESDPYMKLLRVLTLRQMHNEALKNETIKQMLVTTATGVNLDHLGLERGIIRDKGEKPRALYRFELSAIKDVDTIIPANTVLNNSDNLEAFVLEDLIIKAGESSVVGYVELQQYIDESSVVIDNLVTDLPFVEKVVQLESFSGGFSAESDDRYRERIILANATYSTAGAIDAYRYFALSADSRIKEVAVLEENVLYVNIYLTSLTGVVDAAMIERVESALNDKSVRPLTDRVVVKSAEYKNVTINLTVYVTDFLKIKEIEDAIRANLNYDFKIGEDFMRSELIAKSMVNYVKDVETDFTNIICSAKEVVVIDDIKLNFKKAEL